MKSTQNAAVALAGACLLAALSLASLLWLFGKTEDEAMVRSQNLAVLSEANALLSAMKDAETGQRGYLLTGDEAFLEPYLAVRDEFSGRLATLNKLSVDSMGRKHTDALAPLIDAKLAHMANAILLRRQQDVEGAQAVVRSGEGRRLMDAIRTEMDAFILVEEAALLRRNAEFTSSQRDFFAVIVGTSLLALFAALLFALMIYRQAQQKIRNRVHLETQRLLDDRNAVNTQLEQANRVLQESEEKLAVTLKSIGDAVIATDADARVTLMNRLAERLTGWSQAEAAGHSVNEVFRIVSKATRLPSAVPVMETLEKGTVQGLANHTVLMARDGSECDIADSCAPIRNHAGTVIGAVLVFRDVTAEYAAQQTLRDSVALVETVLNTVADGIITIHAHGSIVEKVNPAAERMFGYRSEELLGKALNELIPELDREQHSGNVSLEYFTASVEEKAAGIAREVLGRRKNGERFPMEMSVSEMTLGGQRYFTGILRDISTRKMVEAALLKAGALQNAIFKSANFSSIATDAHGVIQLFNVGAERMLGYAAADVLNKITPADISDPQEVIARAEALSVELGTPIAPGFEALVFKASRGIEDIYELTYVRKDGGRIPAIVSVTALRDAQDKIIGYLLIGTDNTARKQADEELQRANAKLETWARALNSFAIVAETDLQGRITYANDPFCGISGYSREELIGKNHRDVVNSAYHPKEFWREMWKSISGGQAWQGEIRNRAKDGRIYWVDTIIVPLPGDDDTPGAYLAFRFVITERKRLDQLLKESNVELEIAKALAEKANLAKSDFLSSMSHELRTPLGAILGFAQLMESATPPPTPVQSRSIEQILRAGWYLLDLINEILDLALIESGKLSLSLEPVSLGDVIHECEAMIEPQAEKRSISLMFPQPGLSAVVLADRTRLKQVFVNLLSNAVKYNRQGGAVVVVCRESIQGRIRICVEDTGEGLSAEKLAQLFQPFNRLGQESKTEEGTGIGLVVCRRLIELMGGVIGVESTVGKGSVFWIEMALAGEGQQGAQVVALIEDWAAPVQTGTQLHTLLYVEDNPANLMLVEDLIARRADIRLLSARDGLSGIKLARSSMPDVILMDLNLPGISGTKALRILAEDPATAHIPVIALSANAMPRDIEKGMEAGFFRYLTKPIKVQAFMDTLDLALKSLPAKNEETS